MQQVPLKQKVAMVLPYLQRAGFVSQPPPCDAGPRLAAILEAAGDRIKIAGDILNHADFFTDAEQLPYEPKAVQKRLVKPQQAIALLKRFREELAATKDFTAPALDTLLHAFVEREGIKIGEIIHALRVAVTGKAVGFGVFETLAILGQESCLQRIDRAIEEALRDAS